MSKIQLLVHNIPNMPPQMEKGFIWLIKRQLANWSDERFPEEYSVERVTSRFFDPRTQELLLAQALMKENNVSIPASLLLNVDKIINDMAIEMTSKIVEENVSRIMKEIRDRADNNYNEMSTIAMALIHFNKDEN